MTANKQRRSKWYRRVRLAVVLVACAALLYHGITLFRVIRLRGSDPANTSLMGERAGEAAARGLPVRKEFVWVPYERMSSDLVRAVLAGEDLRFFHHGGVDLTAVKAAIREDLKERSFARGGSTINQQLAKNLFLSSSKNPVRKLHEALIAVEMEHILGERRILELYLNVIEWGDGIYGAEAAARHYFNTPASSLSAEQAVFLAAIIPTPRAADDPAAPSEQVKVRIFKIKFLMHHPLLKHPLLETAERDGNH